MKNLRDIKAINRINVISIFDFNKSDLLVDKPIGTVIGWRDAQTEDYTVQLELKKERAISTPITLAVQKKVTVPQVMALDKKSWDNSYPVSGVDTFYFALLLAVKEYEEQLAKTCGEGYRGTLIDESLVERRLFKKAWKKWLGNKNLVAVLAK